MPDKYTWHLWQLSQLSNEQLQAIQITTVERKWLHELLKAMSPARKQLPNEDYDENDDWPRYVPEKVLKKGGEALIILGYDKKEKRQCVFKIALPTKPPPEIIEEIKPKQSQSQKILKQTRELLQIVCYRKEKKEKEKYSNEDTEHFRRGFILQKQLRQAMQRKGLQKYGYIPDVYEFHEAPQLWYSMEYINGESLISWCKNVDNINILSMFLHIVIFIESCCHNFATVHSDIAPKNILILNELPVLLDFGIAKCLQADTITNPNSQLGTPLYASEIQISDSRNRGFKEDMFSLARTFWSMWNRSEPDFSSIVLQKDTRGKLIYDAEAINQLFKPDIFPLVCKYFYIQAIHGEYEDISEMRTDIERALQELSTFQQNCITKCQFIQKLQEKINKIVNLWK